jgi:hypothetical protein
MNQSKSNSNRYLITISLLFACMLIITNALLVLKFNDNSLIIIINGFLAMFYASSAVSGVAVIKSNEKRPQDIIRASMVSATLKLLGYLLILGLCVYAKKEIAREMVGFFFVQYFVFTITEKIFILKFLRR